MSEITDFPMTLEGLNMKIAYDELEDRCIELNEAIEKLQSSYCKLRKSILESDNGISPSE